MKQLCIGIHCHEQPELLHETLESLRRNTSSTVKLMLLPDGPHTRMRQALRGLDHIPQSGTAEPSGTAACFNRLANATRADIVVLLEGGAQVGPRWLDHLLAALDSDPRNGLAGPSTNHSWNEQCVFPRSGNHPAEIVTTAMQTEAKFGNQVRTLDPLYSLADFCYAVRREVIEAVGPADEGYSLGPCWEMDYNIRAARAGWRGVWACGAYVYRAPFTERRRREEARLFEASKRRYQDKFCGARLRGEKTGYRKHCRGDACPNFAPVQFSLRWRSNSAPPPAREPGVSESPLAAGTAPVASPGDVLPLVSCIMPTCNRRPFVASALRSFLQQGYVNCELLVVDDGTDPVQDLVPPDPRIRYFRLPVRMVLGEKRNWAVARAKGEYIFHWDDDDWYPANRVSRQMRGLLQGNADICGTSSLYYYDPTNQKSWLYAYPRGQRNWVAGNTLAYRRAFWEQHPFPSLQVGEDTRFVWTAVAAQVCDLRDPTLCVGRVHPGNTSRKTATGSCWQPCAISHVQALLGEDLARFLGPPPPALGMLSRPDQPLPLISCIMPTANRRPFVRLALRCFDQQDYPRRELIIVDDGTDSVSDLAQGRQDIIYLRAMARASIGAKRNQACRAARGEIVAHWDDDDWYGPTRLSTQVQPLVRGEAELTGLDAQCMLDLNSGQSWTITPRLHERMFVGNVHGGTLMFRKSIFQAGIVYRELNLAEDACLLRSALQKGKRLIRVPNAGVFIYIRHGSNAWGFVPGRFLDASLWQRTSVPSAFLPWLGEYQSCLKKDGDALRQPSPH